MFLSLFNRSGPSADVSSDRSAYGSFWWEPVGSRTSTGVRVSPASALALSAVFASVRVLAESFAVMPFVLYQPKVGGGRTKNTKHWLYRLIAKRPNKFQTPYEWRLMLMGHLALRGNAFCQITSNTAGEITDLLPLNPDRMQIELLPTGSYRYRYTDQFGETVYYQRNEIWHLRGLSSDGYVGLSPVDLARESIGEGLAMQAYSARFFANDAKPGGGWIEYPGKFRDATTKKTFRDSWQEMQGGGNRGKIAVLENGMKFHELGLKNSDAQFIEARGMKIADIARIFRIPPHKIGDLSKATFSNIESQSIEFWTDTMLPYAELWESSIEFFLLGEDEPLGLDPEFNMARMMRGDSVARTAYYSGGINGGWLTRNEARAAEGFDPLDGLDEPLRPLNMVEESAASDEVAEADDGADDVVQPNSSGDEGDEGGADARLLVLLTGNTQRMARRMAGGQPASAEVLADALAIDRETARQWLMRGVDGLTEEHIGAELLALALTRKLP